MSWEPVDAMGSAGAILVVWHSKAFSVISTWKDEFYLSVLVEDNVSREQIDLNGH